MSVKKKKTGLVISWQRSFSILAPWRKGKGDRDAVLDGEVVLTKMKFYSNYDESLLMSGDSMSTTSTVSVSEQDISDHTKASKVNSHPDKSRESRIETSSDYLPAIFSDPQLQRLYKFESEDSGVDLPSGANSPSTPTGSEKSFVVHSRESSHDSSNFDQNSDQTALPEKSLNTIVDIQDDVFINSEELCSSAVTVELHIDEDVDKDQSRASGCSHEGDEEISEQLQENEDVTERTCSEDIRPGNQLDPHIDTCDDMKDSDLEPEPIKRSDTSYSLEEYMDECCRLSEAQQASASPLGSGLGYLEHICKLLEKIGQLQEINLQLQKHICSLQKDRRMTKTKEDFFQQHCNCGAASLTFQQVQKRQSRSEFLSLSGTLSDLSTIPETTQQPLKSIRRDLRSESLTSVTQCRRGLNRRSYTEGEVHFLGDSTKALSVSQRRLSESSWGRVKDMVRKSKLKNQNRLGLSSASLKLSCPQLYRPDLGPVESVARNRNSMIALGHHSKLDFTWLQ